MTKQVIVLGGSGFLGAQIIARFRKSKSAIITCGDLFQNKTIDCSFKKIDILNRTETVKNLKGFDLVINCIGQITSPFNKCLQLNSIGINNLAYALEKSKARVIHLSSLAVYGSTEICNEKTALNPETNYATAKAYAEFLLRFKVNEQNVTILRLPNLYGGNQKKGICAYIMKSYRSNKKLTFNNNGALSRSFMHVQDCANIIHSVSVRYDLNGIFNVPGPEKYSIKEIIKKFEARFNVKFETNFSDRKPWENINRIDNHFLESVICFKPKFKLFRYFERSIREK